MTLEVMHAKLKRIYTNTLDNKLSYQYNRILNFDQYYPNTAYICEYFLLLYLILLIYFCNL